MQPDYQFIPPHPKAIREGFNNRGTGRTTAQLQYGLALVQAGHPVIYVSESDHAARHNLRAAIDIALNSHPVSTVTDFGPVSARVLTLHGAKGPAMRFMAIDRDPERHLRGYQRRTAIIFDHWIYDCPWPRDAKGDLMRPRGWHPLWFAPDFMDRFVDPQKIEPGIKPPEFPIHYRA